MDHDKQMVIVTLAAAIISVRKAADAKSLHEALEDAEWTIYPAPTNSRFKTWQTKQGMIPTTAEEDAAKKAATLKAMASARKNR